MDAYQRRRFENLLSQAKLPEQECIAREHIARAFGYIDGLLEGNVIAPEDYSGYFTEISQVEDLIQTNAFRRIGIAS